MTLPPTRPIGFLVGDLARLMRRRFERVLADAETGLTVAEARTLAFVEHYSGARQSVLAEKLGVEPMTVSGSLDRLETAGYVMREADPTDRRAKRVVLTEAAAPVLDQIHAVALRLRAQAFAGLTPDEVDAVFDLLERMQQNLASPVSGSSE